MSAQEPTNASGWPPHRLVLLFDGVCHLCQRSVKFVLRHERDETMAFCPLQSPAGRDLLARHGLPADYTGSLVFVEGGRAHLGADAVLHASTYLRAPWSWLRVFSILPRSVREWLYRAVAARRYRWFGRDDEVCFVPEPRWRDRLLTTVPPTR